MKWTVLTLLTVQFVLATPRPSESLFEIEKQRLIKFPEETFPSESNEQKSIDAKRILEEIDKINVALGYVKKQESHIPSILDSNQFLFPKPSYHPFYSQTNGGTLQPSIRNLNVILNPQSLRNAHNPKSIKLNEPKLFFYYYLPKTAETTTETKSQHSDKKIQAKLHETEDNFVPNFRKQLLNNVSSSLKNKKLTANIRNKKLARIEKLPTIRPFSKATTEKQNLNNAFPTSKVKKQVTSFPTSTTLSPPISSLKTPFASFFNRPSNVLASQKVEAKPILQSVPLTSPQFAHQQANPEVNSNDDYKWDEISSEESDNSEEFEKHIFSAKRKEVAEVQKEALKESGIIIQRLKVRKGGIAIAGPGGVATAGSGGTAIVGPGGYALTHPRSLTIAGPGAKVFAIPESTDLKDAILRTNLGRNFASEGVLVATGPVIYYSPDDRSQIL